MARKSTLRTGHPESPAGVFRAESGNAGADVVVVDDGGTQRICRRSWTRRSTTRSAPCSLPPVTGSASNRSRDAHCPVDRPSTAALRLLEEIAGPTGESGSAEGSTPQAALLCARARGAKVMASRPRL